MTSIKVRLYTYRATKKGTYPLVFQIIHQRKKRVIYSSYHLYKECFDEKKCRVISRRNKKIANVAEVNNNICHIVAEIQRTINVLEGRKKKYSVSDVIALYKEYCNNRMVLVYMENQMKILKDMKKYGTLSAYRSTYSRLVKFVGDDNKLLFSDITSFFLNNFILSLRKAELKENSINHYCRILRAVYNKAYAENISGTEANSPFRKVSFSSVSTVKRAIDGKSMKKIIHADMKNNYQLQWAKNIFLFSFYSRGMSFVDMACLKHSNIIDGVIYYRRKKTGHPLRVKIVPQLQQIIDSYRSDSPYVLPILSNDNKSLYNTYRNELRKYNNRLKQLSVELNLESPLTSYVARHSWATLARENGMPVSIISEGLGHNSEKVTYIYLDALNPKQLDSYNEKLSCLYI